MIRSMTGYGRAEGTTSIGAVKVEVRSLNHRFLDLTVRLPRELTPLEMKIREVVRERVSRGKVDLSLRVERLPEGAPHLVLEVDWGLMGAFVQALREAKGRFGLTGEVSLDHIVASRELISFREAEVEEGIWEELQPIVSQALSELIASRQREGEALLVDMKGRLRRLRELVEKVATRAPKVVDHYRERLRERLERLLKGAELDEGRFEQEVALFAERSDITEEVVRLRSHIEGFEGRLEGGGPVGRALEFLLQEMNREANTIGSKANDLEIVQGVLAIKEEVEKLREQVQNVE